MSRMIPRTGLLRLAQIIGTEAASQRRKEDNEENNSEQNSNEGDNAASNLQSPKKQRKKSKRRKADPPYYEPFIPVSKSTWWAGVASGRYPAPVRHLGQRITAWKAEEIWKLVEEDF